MHFEYNYNKFDKDNELLNSVRSLKFDDFEIISKLKKFFNDVLTSWDDLNSDLIVSNININNHEDTALFINELFSSLFELSMKSETTINANNVIAIINSLDRLLPEILISSSNGSYHALNEYENVKDRSITACFNRVKLYLDEHCPLASENVFVEIKNVFLILTRISRIKYSRLYVYKFASFLWNMLHIYNENRKILEDLLFCLSNISDQLAKFLIRRNTDDDENSNELFLLLALEIFDTLKNDLIHCKFLTSEIPYVLNILDCRDRFIGRFVDAVPENKFENGYVLCYSLSQQSLENYDDNEDDENDFPLDNKLDS